MVVYKGGLSDVDDDVDSTEAESGLCNVVVLLPALLLDAVNRIVTLVASEALPTALQRRRERRSVWCDV